MILKAGTYRFNDVLTVPANVTADINGTMPMFNDAPFINIALYSEKLSDSGDVTLNNVLEVTVSPNTLVFYAVGTGWNGWATNLYGDVPAENLQTHTITDDIEVTDEFGAIYIANTNYNEVNPPEAKPLAEITYNGQTIAELNAGETCTIKCAEKRMITDITVKLNKQEQPVDDSIVGTWVFKETLTNMPAENDIVIYPFEFTFEEARYYGLRLRTYSEYYFLEAIQDKGGEGMGIYYMVFDSEWETETRSIIIDRDPNIPELSTWLKANATKQ